MVIQEGKQVGILYHFTDTDSLVDIIKSDTIEAHEINEYGLEDHGKYVSFSRNKNFANETTFFKFQCCIVIDGDRLSNRYHIEPHYWEWQNPEITEDQFEEQVKGDINNLDEYIIKIILFKKDLKFMQWIENNGYAVEIQNYKPVVEGNAMIKLLDLVTERVDLRNDPVVEQYLNLIKGATTDEELVKIINDIFLVAYQHGERFALEMAKKHLH